MKNCLTYALGKWWSEGGYVLIRRSHFYKDFNLSWWHPLYWLPHFLHRSFDKVVTQFSPTEKQRAIFKRKGIWYTWFHLWNIKGQVRGDDE